MIRPTTHHLQSVLVEIPQLRLLLLSYALHYFEGHSTFVQGSSDTGYGYTLFKVVTNEINHFMAAHIGFFRKLMTEGHLHYRGDLRIGARAVRWDGRSSVSCIRRSCSADSANATGTASAISSLVKPRRIIERIWSCFNLESRGAIATVWCVYWCF